MEVFLRFLLFAAGGILLLSLLITLLPFIVLFVIICFLFRGGNMDFVRMESFPGQMPRRFRRKESQSEQDIPAGEDTVDVSAREL